MRRLLPLLTLALALTAAPTATAAGKPLYADGPAGRYLLDGTWLFRLDNEDQGIKRRYMRSASTAGWTRVTVPSVWNLGDPSNASMAGGIGWYRKDFRVPDAGRALAWALRFESVNYRARVWLNGRPVGQNTGAYLPFELPARGVKRTGTNRLVVRVDSRRSDRDFPPASQNADGVPTGGWWNYSGIQREVYLRRLDTVDFAHVEVQPRLACARCAASVHVRIDLRNVTRGATSATITGSFGNARLNLGTKTIRPGGTATFTDRLRIARPKLWSPEHPNLYRVRFSVRAGGRRVAAYALHSGVRSIKVAHGRLVLNGEDLNLRGVGLHEDSKAAGFAIDDARREQLLREAKALGATVIRTHYPLHPYTHELADRLGLLIWSEIPVYSVKTNVLKNASVRRRAVRELTRNIEANQNHPSVLLWSVGNELSTSPGPSQVQYLDAAARAARRADPTRPVGYAVAGYPSALCQAAAYRSLDVLGLNDYFGWYPGPFGQLMDRTRVSGYLDAARACYPDKALMVTEFGAEANRDGPVEEKGTWAFQQDFVNYQLGVFATKPWLSGAIYWALNEFWVRPAWEGGNPRPTPPVHQKGLLTYDWVRKPAWADVQRWYTQTRQFATSR